MVRLPMVSSPGEVWITLSGLTVPASSAAAAVKGRRDVWFAEAGGVQPTVVLDRGKLLRGNVIDGPAIIEEPDASTLVHPGWTATVDEHANLVLRPLS